jgi:hypothetical protein
MTIKPEILGTDITLVGPFHPASFSARWLLDRGLVRESDVDEDNAPEEKLRNDFYRLTAVPFQVTVMQERMTVQGAATSAPLIKDLVLGLLEINAARSISALGMNFYGHYRCESEEQWHHIGNTLLPKPIWAELFPNDHIGMLTAQTRVTQPGDDKHRKDLSVQPSEQIPNGVYVGWNDHHVFGADATDPEISVSWAIETIAGQYDQLSVDTYKLFATLLDHAAGH